jgi:hypothetical protein
MIKYRRLGSCLEAKKEAAFQQLHIKSKSIRKTNANFKLIRDIKLI